ncbi:DUF86 domain-containing protein [Candidatus Falkowbacteria bacterium]|nr:MAG: DUF86 domain-containing protein [Candidatus Falkowbacteria bacterium]
MKLDKQKIKKRFSEINESLAEISRLTGIKEKEFWKKKENLAAVKYYLLLAIEAVGSVCVHIAAKKYSKGVSTFGECFNELEKAGLFSKDLALSLRRMVKFRNKLIHQYWEIDNKKIFQYCRKNLDDFNRFMKKVNEIL